MIIYKDMISGDEMFGETYKIAEVENGLFYEVEGKSITRTEDFDDSKIGANASQEEMAEKTSASSVSDVDIVMNHRLMLTPISKKGYMSYIKTYAQSLQAHVQVTNPERVEQFKKDLNGVVKKILRNFDKYKFYTGESTNVDGMLAILDYRDDDVTPVMLFFKDGLITEKY